MELYEAVKARRSVRAYKPDPVPEEALSRILRAAQAAPSWKNSQGWHIVVVRERDMIEQIGRALSGNPRGTDYHTLPALLVLAMDPDAAERFDGKEYYLVDAGIVGEHLILAAQAEGLGTCWVGWFEEAPIKRLLGIPDKYRVVMLTPLGYPAREIPPRPRKALAEIVHEGRW